MRAAPARRGLWWPPGCGARVNLRTLGPRHAVRRYSTPFAGRCASAEVRGDPYCGSVLLCTVVRAQRPRSRCYARESCIGLSVPLHDAGSDALRCFSPRQPRLPRPPAPPPPDSDQQATASTVPPSATWLCLPTMSAAASHPSAPPTGRPATAAGIRIPPAGSLPAGPPGRMHERRRASHEEAPAHALAHAATDAARRVLHAGA